MDMEEIILEHMRIRKWVDNFAKEVSEKKNENDRKSTCE